MPQDYQWISLNLKSFCGNFVKTWSHPNLLHSSILIIPLVLRINLIYQYAYALICSNFLKILHHLILINDDVDANYFISLLKFNYSMKFFLSMTWRNIHFKWISFLQLEKMCCIQISKNLILKKAYFLPHRPTIRGIPENHSRSSERRIRI